MGVVGFLIETYIHPQRAVIERQYRKEKQCDVLCSLNNSDPEFRTDTAEVAGCVV